MSMKEVNPLLNNVLLALQLSLGLWQFIKLTRIGALIQGVTGCLLRPFRLSTAYSRLQICNGQVFKRANCHVLQANIPSKRTAIKSINENTINLLYLGSESTLERRESQKNMLFVNEKMRYYIIPASWEELQTLEDVLRCPADAKVDAASESAARTAAASGGAPRTPPVFVKGSRQFWEEVITDGVMSLEEVLDEVILNNQRVSVPLNDDWLLPVNLSMSEEKLLIILNLVGLFLQTKVMVHWFVSASLSFISALMEFIPTLRVWLYTQINVVFCYILHFTCDRLPRSWRRQVYSLGKWVKNAKPGNDIELKIIRGKVRAIIAGSVKIQKEAANSVPWLNVAGEGANSVRWLNVADEQSDVVEKQFRCDPIDITCKYFVRLHICQISAPTISAFRVECKSKPDFEHIITLVSCMAKNRCGSLKCYGPKNKVSVRGFKESVISYVKSDHPPVYEVELENVVVT